MKKYILWSGIVALAGFLFGFDTVVISGAEKTLQELWSSSDGFHGAVVVGSALWGTVLGAMLGGFPTNAFGRKQTLIGIGVLFFVSGVGAALVDSPFAFAFFRFIGGLGIGASTIAAPAYISEIAPSSIRGRLVAMYQLSIVGGILVAFISNYLLRDAGEHAWRWMIGIEVIPALLYGLLIFKVPESPRWLALNGRMVEAEKVLKAIVPHSTDPLGMLKVMRHEPQESQESIFTGKYRGPLLLAFFIAFFNQFSGINAFLYFGPRIFEGAGLSDSAAFLSSVGIGIVNFAFTLVGMTLIDRMGRKSLMYIGSIGYIVSLSLGAMAFFLDWQGLAVPVFLFLFIAAHAIGQGTVIWVFIAEIFPTHLRAHGQAFGSSVHWILAAIIPSSIPFLISEVGEGALFTFFAGMMVFQLFWVWKRMPETRGQSLESVSERVSRST